MPVLWYHQLYSHIHVFCRICCQCQLSLLGHSWRHLHSTRRFYWVQHGVNQCAYIWQLQHYCLDLHLPHCRTSLTVLLYVCSCDKFIPVILVDTNRRCSANNLCWMCILCMGSRIVCWCLWCR